jgi:hypothetical protein
MFISCISKGKMRSTVMKRKRRKYRQAEKNKRE